MKKSILAFLATSVASITISQLVNSNTTNTMKDNQILNLEQNLNKNNDLLLKFNQEYNSRTEILNNAIKQDLIKNIILVNNQIIIDYQNLNPKLYSEEIYQLILSSQYIKNLTQQYQLNLLSFDENHHIIFDKNNSNQSNDV